MKVYKYAITLGRQNIKVPLGAKFISAGLDGLGVEALWALVNEQQDAVEERDVTVVGTGHEFFTGDLEFVGTFTQGPFVWHVFAQQPLPRVGR